jgi:hypothetical protein
MVSPTNNIPSGLFNFGSTSHDISSTTTTTIAHGLGVIPKRFRVVGSIGTGTAANAGVGSYAEAFGTNGNIQTIGIQFVSSSISNGNTASNSGFTFWAGGSYTNSNAGTVTVDATNISISWSKSGSPTGTITLIWEAMY